MPRSNLSIKVGLVLLSAACLGTLGQVEVPLLAKPFVLLLPLQMAAIAYVLWYWRDRHESCSPQRLVAGMEPDRESGLIGADDFGQNRGIRERL